MKSLFSFLGISVFDRCTLPLARFGPPSLGQFSFLLKVRFGSISRGADDVGFTPDSRTSSIRWGWSRRAGCGLRHCNNRGCLPIPALSQIAVRMLFEGHADLLWLAPDDVAGNVRVVRLEDKVETFRNVESTGDFECRPRNGNVVDQAAFRTASELNYRRHQYRFARNRASFHEGVL